MQMSKGIVCIEIDSYSAFIFTVTCFWVNSINEKAMKIVVGREVPTYTLHNWYTKGLGYNYKDIYSAYFVPKSIRQSERVLKCIFLKLSSHIGKDEKIQGKKEKKFRIKK